MDSDLRSPPTWPSASSRLSSAKAPARRRSALPAPMARRPKALRRSVRRRHGFRSEITTDVAERFIQTVEREGTGEKKISITRADGPPPESAAPQREKKAWIQI